ncbi:acetyltransferase [Pelotomaculum terephthalicicum JT]|uniref:acetyltransferase n=1 Tax=Pelotomaculum TaxID=191373 RepID=UPI0009D390CD|nr:MULTISPECIES: acetyltransferase [Pelotomaculum]MCG9967990.1 acetyltransferase [Pelotomaculum terephthalicicum JT]OPX88590.1 MAG: putative acetyltransferase EpsM [Pelotomaculum sp. PtaB.Bin117]OPY63037.1 MAG: putative acetyltransferase EpsM [Pelotomaculum sp. PtaU1.Bin065]
MGASPVVVIGAGGHATVVLEIIKKTGVYEIVGYTGPVRRQPATNWDLKYLGDDSVLPFLRRQGVKLAALGVGAVGDNRLRCKLYEQVRAYGFSFPPLIHPDAAIAGDTGLADGVLVARSVVINPGVEIGSNTIVNSGAIVEHDCSLSEHVHVSPGAVLCGGVKVGRLAHVGANAVVIQGLTIGEGALVGAGSVVLHDVEPLTVVAGNPARVIKKMEERF